MIYWESKPSKESAAERAYKEEKKLCRQEAIYYVAGRHRTSGQLRKKLKQNEHDFSTEIIEAVISDLYDDYLFDEEIADTILRQRRGRKAESKRALARRLKHLGVKEDIISRKLDNHISDFTLYKEYVTRRQTRLLKAYLQEKDYETRRKLLYKLYNRSMSKGFSSETIFSFFNSLENNWVKTAFSLILKYNLL